MLKSISSGFVLLGIGIVSVILSVSPFITEIELESKSVTYALSLTEFIVTPDGDGLVKLIVSMTEYRCSALTRPTFVKEVTANNKITIEGII
jgi:hypothetical protein